MQRDKIRLKQYSYQTEKTYLGWIKRYILFHNKTHSEQIGKKRYRSIPNSSCSW